MQSGRPGLVGDLHLGAQLDQAVERALVGRAHVRGGDDAQPATALAQLGELLLDHPQALPLDEGAQQVDGVRGGQLAGDLEADARLTATVDEECAGGQRDRGTLGKGRRVGRAGGLSDGEQRPRWCRDGIVVGSRVRGQGGDRLDHVVGQLDLATDCRSVAAASDPQGARRQLGNVASQRLVSVDRVELTEGDEGRVRAGQSIAQGLGQQVLVDARSQVPHVSNVSGRVRFSEERPGT